MFDKMKQLYDMQKQAKEMQKSVEALKIEKIGAGGKIRLVMNGAFKVEELAIDESLLIPAQKSFLEKTLRDLMSAAAEDAGKQSAAQAMSLMKQMNITLPGM